jgi:oxysterol-binding protein 1
VETAATVKESINRKDYATLEQVLKYGRAKALLHMNRLDIETGSTFLHDAARRGDKRLVETLLTHGADPIRRDRKGKLPYEVTKDQDIRNMLRASTPAKAASSTPAPGEPISQKGYLKKWTNYARGSKLRWFILENTTLSYYKHPGIIPTPPLTCTHMVDDTESACRGSLNMKNAKLKLDQSDKQKFEIIAGGKGSVRYHLRANHPVEANRWIFALTQSIQAATAESQAVADDGGPTLSRVVSGTDRPVAGHRSTSSLDLRQKLTNMTNSSAASINTEDDSGEDYPENSEEPHREEFEVTARSAQVQLEILEKLLGSLPQQEHPTRLRPEVGNETPVGTEDSVAILKKAASSLHGTLDELVKMSQTRDTYWRGQLEREKELRRLWEENMELLAEEQEHMEEAMNTAIEQRRMTKRALRAMSIAVQQPDKGAEYIRRMSITETDIGSIRPESIVPPEALAEVISSDDDEEEFFDAIGGSETSTLQEEVAAVTPTVVGKEATSKEQELILSTHGYEAPIRTKFEKLDKDNRPKISLWGILKSMVGKDMTKMVWLCC